MVSTTRRSCAPSVWLRQVCAISMQRQNRLAANALPSDWRPAETSGLCGRSRYAANRIQLEAEKFKNYWTAKTGAGAVSAIGQPLGAIGS